MMEHETKRRALLVPAALKGIWARNRLVVAAMTNQQSHDDGRLSDEELRWLLARAEGGFGIVTTCAAYVDPVGKAWPGQLGIADETHLEGLTRLAGALKRAGALSLVQLHHGGYRASKAVSGYDPISATDFVIDAPDFERPRKPSTDEVDRIVDRFVAAALLAEQAGFDGVELHGAHTYLISQFLSAEINTRDDRWGGGLDNRYRFLSEMITRIRRRVLPGFIVGVRLSPGVPAPHAGISLAECLRIAPWMVADGIDFIHLSLKSAAGDDDPERSGARVIPAFRLVLPPELPVFACGAVQDRQQAERVLELGADFVAMARSAIGNHDLPRRLAAGAAPRSMPYNPADLVGQEAVSDIFLDYLRRFSGLLVP